MTDLTRPENSVHVRQRKRMEAAVRKRGLCCICVNRETTLGIVHCRNAEDRRGGACQIDGRLPAFQFDDSTFPHFADAA